MASDSFWVADVVGLLEGRFDVKLRIVRMFVNDYNDLNSIWQISVTATPCNLMSNLTFLGKDFSMVIQYFLVTTWQNGVLYRNTVYPNLQCMTAAYVHRLLLQVKKFFLM